MPNIGNALFRDAQFLAKRTPLERFFSVAVSLKKKKKIRSNWF